MRLFSLLPGQAFLPPLDEPAELHTLVQRLGLRAPDVLRGLLASPFRRGKKRVRVNAFERLVGKANLFEFAANLLKRQRWPAVPDRQQREGECAFHHQCDETYGDRKSTRMNSGH